MQNEIEWYWYLNLHRDQLSLVNNSSIANNLPISSNLYTSAVLNNDGICVGMRNVHLKDEHFPRFHRPRKIPNCCSNWNVVGQRNQQLWETAFDRIKNSILTDPSMAIHSTVFKGHGIQPNIIQPHEIQCDEKLIGIAYFNLYQPHPIKYSNRYGQKEIPSFVLEKFYAPTVATPTQEDTSRTIFNIRTSENEEDSECVAPPKKKWIRNYMQSNSRFHIKQFPNWITIIHSFFHLHHSFSVFCSFPFFLSIVIFMQMHEL